jgi:hypothetical protein
MGFIGDLFDKDARRKNRIASLTKKACQKFGQTDDRVGALNGLNEIKDDEALRGLIKRFSVSCDNKLHDQDEKKYVSDLLVERGPEVVPFLKEYVAKQTEVTWAFRTLRRIEMQEAWIGHVLETIGTSTSEDTDPEKLEQLVNLLHDQKDPRVAPAVARLLKDLDDTVRFAAIETLATLGDDLARQPLLDALVNPGEESQRVLHRIIDVFVEQGWEVKGHRKAVEERLPEDGGYYLDRSGHIKRLAAGQAQPEDAGE